MQAKGHYSNHLAGSVEGAVADVLVAMASHEARWALSRLHEKLLAVRADGSSPREIESRRRRSRRPGWVLDAVVRVLSGQAQPMRVVQAHAAVEALLGAQVSANSVSWVLARHAGGPSPLFVRVARGRYVLASGIGGLNGRERKQADEAVTHTHSDQIAG